MPQRAEKGSVTPGPALRLAGAVRDAGPHQQDGHERRPDHAGSSKRDLPARSSRSLAADHPSLDPTAPLRSRRPPRIAPEGVFFRERPAIWQTTPTCSVRTLPRQTDGMCAASASFAHCRTEMRRLDGARWIRPTGSPPTLVCFGGLAVCSGFSTGDHPKREQTAKQAAKGLADCFWLYIRVSCRFLGRPPRPPNSEESWRTASRIRPPKRWRSAWRSAPVGGLLAVCRRIRCRFPRRRGSTSNP